MNSSLEKYLKVLFSKIWRQGIREKVDIHQEIGEIKLRMTAVKENWAK